MGPEYGTVLLLVSLPFLAIGLAIFGYGGLTLYSIGKRLLGTAHASVSDPVDPGDAPRGAHAIVTGRAIAGPDGALTAPLSGADAVAHRYRIEQESPEVGWWTVADSGDSTPFELQGPTGRLLVDPGDTVPSVPTDRSTALDADEPLPDRVRERLEASDRFDLAATPGLLASAVDEPRRYEEATVDTGETVYVYGYVTDDDRPRIDAGQSNEFRFGSDSPSGLTEGDPDTLRDVGAHLFFAGVLLLVGGMFTLGGGAALFIALSELVPYLPLQSVPSPEARYR